MRRTAPVRPVETQDFASLQSDAPAPEYNPSVWQRLVEWLHKQKGYDPKRLTDPEPRAAIEETRRILAKPLGDLAITQDIPEELTATLDQNIFFFSGFKTHHELEEASRMLKGDDGNFKPFQQFLKDVETINKVYNRNYLQAEYNFATASTQMAVKWKEWEQEGDRYDLQYRTAGDSRVREEHAALDGITLPPSDPFWDSYLPPNGWNCRCTAVQVRQGKYPRSDSAAAMAAGANCTDTPKKQIFRFNPGKQEKIFPPKHPYFPKGCGDCQYKQLSYNADSPNCQACLALQADIKRREENRRDYERLKKDPDYRDVEFDEASGGVKATHVGHEVHSADKEETFFKEQLTSTQLEEKCQDVLYRLGNRAVLCNEKNKNPQTNIVDVALDLDLNGKRVDIASITQQTTNIRNVLSGKNIQLKKFNHLDYVTEPADAVCLYFHEPSMYDSSKIVDGIDKFKNISYTDKETGERRHPTNYIRRVYCVINTDDGKLEIFDVE